MRVWRLPPGAKTIPSGAKTIPPEAETIPPEAETIPPEAETIPPEAEIIPPVGQTTALRTRRQDSMLVSEGFAIAPSPQNSEFFGRSSTDWSNLNKNSEF